MKMNDDERDNEFEPTISLWWLVWLAVMLAIGVAFTSCKTKTVVVEKTVDRYITKTDTLRDSVRNDVFIKEFVKGDTVFRDRIETKYKYVYRSLTDTFIQRDSIPYIIEVEKPVEKKLTFWQRVRLWLFYPLLVLSALFIIGKIVRKVT